MARTLPLLAILFSLLAASPGHAAESWVDSLPAWKRFAWSDLHIILNRGEELQFRELETAAELEEWRRRFWHRRDPTPTTAANERRDLHEKRLASARLLYPADNDVGVDRRGWDYVLLGPPDETIRLDDWFDDTGHHPAREIWMWTDLELRSTYSDWNLDGEFELAFNEGPSSRGDVQRRLASAYSADGRAEDLRVLEDLRLENPDQYQELLRMMAEGEVINTESVQSVKLMADLMGPKFRRMEGNYIRLHQDRRDPYVHDFQVEPLWAVFAVDSYRGDGVRSLVELSHQLRLRDLNCQWDFEEQVFRGDILRRVVFYDSEDQVAASAEDRLPVRAEQIEDAQTPVLLPGLSRHLLQPGHYRMALRLEDVGSGRLQIFTTPVEVPAFPTDSLRISDITFANALESAPSQPHIFGKGEWLVFPHPLRSYSPEHRIHIYFEVYGLRTDAQGLNDYSVSYRIRPRNPRVKSSWLWTQEESISPEVSSTFRDRHGGELARHPLTIPAVNFGEDSYVLEVEVTDRLSGRKTLGNSAFSILHAANLR